MRTPHNNSPQRGARSALVFHLPALTFFGLLAVFIAFAQRPAFIDRWIAHETGFVEVVTILFALWGAALAFGIFLRRAAFPAKAIGFWFLFFTLGLIVFAGEEASWGQTYLQWQTPEWFQQNNIQNETNLHNLGHNIGEEIPKGALLLAALIGGIAWPVHAALTKRSPLLGGWFGWLWPAAYLWPAAAITWIYRIGERVMVWNSLDDTQRGIYDSVREGMELFAILWVLMYLHDVWFRMRAMKAAPAPADLKDAHERSAKPV